jgi:uncharacterized membrane protein
MKFTRANWIGFAFVVVSFMITAALYASLPQNVAIHFDFAGQPDSFAPKPWGPFLLPAVTLGTWAVLLVLPAISPRGFRIDDFRGVYDGISLLIVGFTSVAGVLALAGSLSGPDTASVARWVPAALGVSLVVIGNYMGKFRRNFFIGIRTPWTLASEEVWFRTHRLGAKVFVVGGLLVTLGAALSLGKPFTLGVILGIAAIPIVYSFVISRHRDLGGGDRGDSAADSGSNSGANSGALD